MDSRVGQRVEFPSNGFVASGFLALPPTTSGPGVIVIQEWWGLNAQIKGVVDRLADAGFVTLAPDIYRGEIAAHDEIDKASRLMRTLPPERAAQDMGGAIDYLAAHSAVKGAGLGVIGFCMGGMLAFLLAAQRPDRVVAAVPFYGFPEGAAEPDWTSLTATVRGRMASRDAFFSPEAARALEAKLRGLGIDVTLTIHDAGHAFMNEDNPRGAYDPDLAAQLWPETIAFLHNELG